VGLRLLEAPGFSRGRCHEEGNNLPCGGCGAQGNLSAALYTQTFIYDALNRLTSSPLGSYTYGNASLLHAATNAGGYTAHYDVAGSMTCRAPTSVTTCTGTPTGAVLSYDNEHRLSGSRRPAGQLLVVGRSQSSCEDGAAHGFARTGRRSLTGHTCLFMARGGLRG
jgi:hypothetical protein